MYLGEKKYGNFRQQTKPPKSRAYIEAMESHAP